LIPLNAVVGDFRDERGAKFGVKRPQAYFYPDHDEKE
jgi:hypothetical protein